MAGGAGLLHQPQNHHSVQQRVDGLLFGLIDTHLWGTGLIYNAAVLTIWSMVYYLQKALPEIRAKAR